MKEPKKIEKKNDLISIVKMGMAHKSEPRKRTKKSGPPKKRLTFHIPREDMDGWRKQLNNATYQGNIYSKMAKHYARHRTTVKDGFVRSEKMGW